MLAFTLTICTIIIQLLCIQSRIQQDSIFVQQVEVACIIFVAIEQDIEYQEHAFKQARLFNPFISIYLITTTPYEIIHPILAQSNIVYINAHTLPKSSEHSYFNDQTTLQGGYWQLTTQRFFYVADLMRNQSLKHVFHMEGDMMIYIDVQAMLPIFKRSYKGLATTCMNECLAISGFMYIPTLDSIRKLCKFLNAPVSNPCGGDWNDMKAVAGTSLYFTLLRFT